MTTLSDSVFQIHITEGSVGKDDIVAWTWPNGGFERTIQEEVYVDLEERASAVFAAMWKEEAIHSLISDLGRRIGKVFVGEASASLLNAFESRRTRFILCAIAGHSARLAALPWELLILPGHELPLLFQPRLRGVLEFVRFYPSGHEASAGAGHKILVAWASAGGRQLSVEQEMQNLRRRFATRPLHRLREVANPDRAELATRLAFQCSLFLYTGHGRYRDGSYSIQLRSGSTNVETLAADLRCSRAKMLVFDSCESGYGSAASGAAKLLATLSEASCLLGIQGPADDNISTWHMPGVVESVLLGEPVWSCVNQLRLLLFAHRSDVWFQPVVHLRSDYLPFEPLPQRARYFERLLGGTTRIRDE